MGLAHGHDAPWLFALLIGLLALVTLAEVAAGGLDAKTIAVLGVLAAMGGALRVLSAGTAGLEPMFFLLVLAGRVLGRGMGFVLGALAIVTGAFLTGGVGPWTPFQMITAGWVGLGAALLPRASGRVERAMLAAYGLVAGLLYGAVMNLWFWPFMGATAPAGAGFVARGAGQHQPRPLRRLLPRHLPGLGPAPRAAHRRPGVPGRRAGPVDPAPGRAAGGVRRPRPVRGPPVTTTLVLGGARSGKSRYAEQLLRDRAGVLYVAPGPVADGKRPRVGRPPRGAPLPASGLLADPRDR